jgi:hypothetical protein
MGQKEMGDDRQEEAHAEMTTTRTHFTFRVDRSLSINAQIEGPLRGNAHSEAFRL